MVDSFKHYEHIIYLKKTTAEEREQVFKDHPDIELEFDVYKYVENALGNLSEIKYLKIAYLFYFLIYLMKKPKNERLEVERKQTIKFRKSLDNIIKIHQDMKNNPWYGIIPLNKQKGIKLKELLDEQLSELKDFRETQKKRTGYNKLANHYMGFIFFRLKDLGYRHNQQINFIYNAFVLFKIEDYGQETDNDSIGEYEQKERIRKVQEKMMKTPGLSVSIQDKVYFEDSTEIPQSH